MKGILILMLITTMIFADLKDDARLVNYEVKVLDYSQQFISEYLNDMTKKKDNVYFSNREFSIFMRVCIKIQYGDLIIKGYKESKTEIDTIISIFNTKLTKCMEVQK